MEPSGFVHLHVHSHYSLQEGCVGVERLVRAAAARGYRTLALTDTDTLAGLVRFVRACRAHRIRPLVGCQLTVVEDDETPSERSGRLVMLAQSELGYRHLVRLVSLAHANGADVRAAGEASPPRSETAARGTSPGGAPGSPRPPHSSSLPLRPFLTCEQLGENARDLLVLTGGAEGVLWRLAQHGNVPGAEAYLHRLGDLVGRNNLAVELAHEGRARDERTCRLLVELARSAGALAVAANDVRFVSPGEDLLLDFLQGRPVDGRRSAGAYAADRNVEARLLSSPAQMTERYAEFPEAVRNTVALAERCEFELPTCRRRFPTHNFVRGLDADSFLWDSVFRRATQRFGELATTVKDRLNREFDDLRRADLCNALVFQCRLNEDLDRRGVTRGPGSGPLATSLVASVLGLTRFDPLRHGLAYVPPRRENAPFPVFRIEVADCQVATVLRSLRSIYDNAVVTRVGRWERWGTGALLEALARWTGLPAARVPRIVESEEWREAVRREEGRPEAHPPDPAARLRSPEVFAYVCRHLEGAPRRLDPIVGQYLLTVENLTNVVAAEQPQEGLGIAQIEAEELDALHLARLDIARNPLLDCIERATASVRQQENPEFRPDGLAAEDPRAARILAEGATMGIGPLESPTAKSLLRARRPVNVDELTALLAELTATRRPSKSHKHATASGDPGQILSTAILCHICAWLKAHHPAAFYAAALTQCATQRRRLRSVWREARLRGVNLLPPDVNLSAWAFVHEGRNTVRCGLSAVGGLGRRAYAEIDRARRGMAFNDLDDLARRTDHRLVRAAQLENLIRAGACDQFGASRIQAIAQLPMVLGAARPFEGRVASRQPLIFFDRPSREWIAEMADDNAKQPETTAQRLALEQQALGFACTADPLDLFADLLTAMDTVRPEHLSSRLDGKRVRLTGYIEGIERTGPLTHGEAVAAIDLSGCLVVIPPALKTEFSALGLAPGAVIVEGTLSRQDFEWRLRAESIRGLQALWNQVVSTERLVLDLRQADRRTLKGVLKALKRYPGQVPVEATAAPDAPKRLLATIENSTVLPCPPLEQELGRLLGPDRLASARPAPPSLMVAVG